MRSQLVTLTTPVEHCWLHVIILLNNSRTFLFLMNIHSRTVVAVTRFDCAASVTDVTCSKLWHNSQRHAVRSYYTFCTLLSRAAVCNNKVTDSIWQTYVKFVNVTLAGVSLCCSARTFFTSHTCTCTCTG